MSQFIVTNLEVDKLLACSPLAVKLYLRLLRFRWAKSDLVSVSDLFLRHRQMLGDGFVGEVFVRRALCELVEVGVVEDLGLDHYCRLPLAVPREVSR